MPERRWNKYFNIRAPPDKICFMSEGRNTYTTIFGYAFDIMAEMLPIIMDMLKRPETTKILSTVTPDGKPHSIVCGSLLVSNPSTVIVGQVYMYKTVENLEVNKNVEFLVCHGAQAYSIQAVLKDVYETGPEMERMEVLLSKMNMKPVAVWEFSVVSAHDEGITEKSGSRIV